MRKSRLGGRSQRRSSMNAPSHISVYGSAIFERRNSLPSRASSASVQHKRTSLLDSLSIRSIPDIWGFNSFLCRKPSSCTRSSNDMDGNLDTPLSSATTLPSRSQLPSARDLQHGAASESFDSVRSGSGDYQTFSRTFLKSQSFPGAAACTHSVPAPRHTFAMEAGEFSFEDFQDACKRDAAAQAEAFGVVVSKITATVTHCHKSWIRNSRLSLTMSSAYFQLRIFEGDPLCCSIDRCGLLRNVSSMWLHSRIEA
jgi:hypothetical protein